MDSIICTISRTVSNLPSHCNGWMSKNLTIWLPFLVLHDIASVILALLSNNYVREWAHCWIRSRMTLQCSASRLLLQGAAPCPLFVTPCPFEKVEMTPCPFDWKKKFKYQSHMAFSSVLPFLLPTHSVDCAVHLLLSHSRALLVSSALFNPFTALIMPFFFSSPR